MIETIIKNYLEAEQALPVLLVQRPDVSEYYLIERTGGSEVNRIRTSTLVVQSYAETKQKAAEMNEEVIRLMLDAVKLDDVASVDLNSNYDFTDTSLKRYRYQAYFDIVHY